MRIKDYAATGTSAGRNTSIARSIDISPSGDLQQAATFNSGFSYYQPTGLQTHIQDLVTTSPRGKEVLPLDGNYYTPGSVEYQLDTGTRIVPHKGVITFSFPDAATKGGIYKSPHWDAAFNFYDAPGYSPFTEAQRVAARISIQTWDDLIAPTFKEVNGPGGADITFQNTYTNAPGEGAHAYYPYDWGVKSFKHVQSDVWTNDPRVDPSLLQLYPGGYGVQAVNHEIGHTLGMPHPGSYNATDDNDHDGFPDPITYQNDAFYFQDSQQYTIMSYFDSYETGAQPIDWNLMRFVLPSTPMVDDVFVIQQMYGADMTTRTGNTTYGFNATADVTNEAMRFHTGEMLSIVTIWDAGGVDTLDLSGYSSNSIIDLREGAYSSAGGPGRQLTLEEINANNEAAGFGPRSERLYHIYFDGNWYDPPAKPGDPPVLVNEGQSWKNVTGTGNDFGMEDNIGIAYGAIIENAKGGSGNDRINGNQANNNFWGNGGADVFVIADYDGTSVLGKTINDTSVDTIRDFHRLEGDKIDVSELGVTSSAVTIVGSHVYVNTADETVHFIVQGDAVQIGDLFFG